MCRRKVVKSLPFFFAILVENSVKSTTEHRRQELLNQLKSEGEIAVYFYQIHLTCFARNEVSRI